MKTMISRRGFLCAAGIASASAVLTACGGSSSSTASSTASSAAASSEAASGESMELIVFAAASLTETLNAIAETYSAENPGVTFSFNFDSSGTLKTQIQEGADCDLFISAGQKQMNQLDSTASAEGNTEGLDFVDAESRVDLLENKVVLCVPEGSDKGIDSFDSLAEHLKAEDILVLIPISFVIFWHCVNGITRNLRKITWYSLLIRNRLPTSSWMHTRITWRNATVLSISWWMNFRTVMMASLTRSNVFAPARHLRVLWWLAMTLSPFTLSAIHRRIILSISLRKWV